MATAVELYREGWKVAITSRNLQRAQKTAFLIQKEVVDAHPCSAIIGVQYEAPSGHDKIVPTCPRKLVDTVQKDFGKITALVNACGINKDGLLVRMSDSDLKNALNANLYGPILLTKAVVKGMISQKKGNSQVLVYVNAPTRIGRKYRDARKYCRFAGKCRPSGIQRFQIWSDWLHKVIGQGIRSVQHSGESSGARIHSYSDD